MKQLIRMQFGSHVYGTNVAKSDTDYKFVFLPDARDLILQRPTNNIQLNTNNTNSRNTAADVDEEGHSLQAFLKHLLDGQTFALDMLFTPDKFFTQYAGISHRADGLWDRIRRNKDKLLSKRVNAFVGYCRAQAGKYGVKGDRLQALQQVIACLKSVLTKDRLRQHAPSIVSAVNSKHVELTGSGNNEYLTVCGRHLQLDKTVLETLQILARGEANYGDRSKAAAESGGADLKALYHAVRIASEAEELLLTGNITFPRPEAPLLLKIRAGELSKDEISEIIDAKLADVEAALLKSTLPEKSNYRWVEEFVLEEYTEAILTFVGGR